MKKIPAKNNELRDECKSASKKDDKMQPPIANFISDKRKFDQLLDDAVLGIKKK